MRKYSKYTFINRKPQERVTITCQMCGTIKTVGKQKNKPQAKFCSLQCSRKAFRNLDRTVAQLTKVCPTCQKTFQTKPGYRIVHCSVKCGQKSKPKCREASERMKVRNPMFIPGVAEMVSQKSKGIDKLKKFRGGNGRGPSKAEAMLAKAGGFKLNHIIPTGHKIRDGSGYPSHYKPDLVWLSQKVVVEVDGHSHDAKSRQQQDRRKEQFLRSLGWKVFRVSNEEVFSDVESVLEKIRQECLFTTLRLKEATISSPTES